MTMKNPINGLGNLLTHEKVMESVSRSGFMKDAITGFILVNMLTWPTFIMLDRKTPMKERAYSAERQFFQELLSLGCHLTISSLFEAGGQWLGGKLLPEAFKDVPGPDVGKMAGRTFDFTRVFGKEAPLREIEAHNAEIDALLRKGLGNAEEKVVIPEVVKGARTLGNIIGPIVALVVVAPWLNNMLLPHFLKGVDGVLGKLSGGKIKLSPEETTPQPAGPEGEAALAVPDTPAPVTGARTINLVSPSQLATAFRVVPQAPQLFYNSWQQAYMAPSGYANPVLWRP
jgi:hypothetical protein